MEPGDRAAPEASITTPFRVHRGLAVGLLGIALLTFLIAILVAAVHIDDRHLLDHVDGSRMALAWYANEGTLYPPLHDDGYYGGTRWMPLPILLHAAAARLTGEYLVSGKLLAYATMAALLLVTYQVLVRLRCPWPLAAALASMVLLTVAGFRVAMTLRADALPLLLQVSAVWVGTRSLRRWATIGAAALAALALLAKLSALWAPGVLAIWLVRRQRRAAGWFVATYALFAVGLLSLFTALSEGRMLTNVFGLGGAGLQEAGLLAAPYRLAVQAIDHATPTWFLLPGVAVAAWYAVRDRRDEEWLLALILSGVVLIMVFADIGADWNHLVDLAVLVSIVVGGLVGRTLAGLPGARAAHIAVSLAVLWVGATGFVDHLVPRALDAAHADPATDPRLDPDPLRGLATFETSLLSEDPYLPVALGQRPVILDPFMFKRIARDRPEVEASLMRRIRAQEFELVVLLVPAEDEDRGWWWDDYHLGATVVREITDAYTYRETRGPYHVYEPRG